ncbi:hypothetical protein LZZ85_13205 [Terrimonas sp. NA20]|uniref:DUF748 domain-containing protein n=1 Tax=Terrimonas ginsenosidimutans TaxID=2908004 RepID=A0ABS9KSF0_9BACT|nr:hypothetical protein [Terrimonas ginsenosidimutans]MCG2615252.1 hypothetical protein [Terrimonas ginsenosidimutans]
MDNIFEIAAKISTPLGLGGLALAGVIYVSSQFANGKSNQNETVVKYLYRLALLCICLGFAGWVLQLVFPSKAKKFVTVNLYLDNHPAQNVLIKGNNLEDNKSTNIYGSVELEMRKFPEDSLILLTMHSIELNIDTTIQAKYQPTLSFFLQPSSRPVGKKYKINLNIYQNDRPVMGVMVNIDNARASGTSDQFGAVQLEFDNVPPNTPLHFSLTNKDHGIDTTMDIMFEPSIAIHLKKPINVPSGLVQKSPAFYEHLEELENRIYRMEAVMKFINASPADSMKQYHSHGLNAVFNGAKGWYQPASPQFAEVPLTAIVSWFRTNGYSNTLADKILSEVREAPERLQTNGIYRYKETSEFIRSMKAYRAVFAK